MIKQEIITINNKNYIKTYSDTYLIQKIGTEEVYTEAIDLTTSNYIYTETNELLPKKDEIEV